MLNPHDHASRNPFELNMSCKFKLITNLSRYTGMIEDGHYKSRPSLTTEDEICIKFSGTKTHLFSPNLLYSLVLCLIHTWLYLLVLMFTVRVGSMIIAKSSSDRFFQICKRAISNSPGFKKKPGCLKCLYSLGPLILS